MFASEHVRVTRGAGFAIYLEGRLFDDLPSAGNPARVLEDGYGCYAYVCREEGGQRHIVGTDKLGFCPLYYHYAADGSTLLFSTNINWLKDKIGRGTVDLEALDELLNLGEVLGNKTMLKEIKRLGHGEKIILTHSQARFVRFWRPEIPDYADEQSYVARNNVLMQEAMERTRGAGKKNVVLLSGGDDSRRIAATAVRIGLDFSFATQKAIHSGNVDDDVELAKQIAQRFRKKIHVEEMASEETYLEDCVFSHYWLGFEAIHMGWLVPVLRAIPSGSMIYDGILGDVGINGHFIKLYPGCIDRWGDNNALADLILREKPLFKVAGVQTTLRERVIGQLEELPDSPYKLTYYFILNHSRRTIALGSQLFKLFGCQVCYPFLYYPLFLQSFSLPPEKKLVKNHQQICTNKYCPELADLPSTRGKVPAEYLIDLSREARLRSLYFARNTSIDPGTIKHYLPEFGNRLNLYRLSALVNFTPGIARFSWIGKPLHFTASLVQWAENSLSSNVASLGGKELFHLKRIDPPPLNV